MGDLKQTISRPSNITGALNFAQTSMIHWGRWFVALGTFVFAFNQILNILLLTYIAQSLETSFSQTLMIFSLGSFLFLFSAPFWARMSDHKPRHIIYSLSLLGLMLSIVLLMTALFSSVNVTSALVLFFLSRLVYGLLASGVSPIAQALQNDLASKEHKNKSMVFHSLSLNAGRLAAAIVLAVLAVTHVLFVFVGLLVFLLMSIFLNFFKPHLQVYEILKPLTQDSESVLKVLLQVLPVALFFTCFMQALNTSMAEILRTTLSESLFDSIQLTAQIFAFVGLGVVLVQSLMRLWIHDHALTLMRLGILSLIIGSLVLFYAKSLPWVLSAMSFFILGIGLIPPIYLSRLKDLGANYGQASGWLSSTQTLGYSLGSFFVALALDWQLEAPLVLLILGLALALWSLGFKNQSKISFQQKAAKAGA